MRELTIPEGELGIQVPAQLRHGLDGSEDSGVQLGLVLHACGVGLLLGSSGASGGLDLLRALLLLCLREVLVIKLGGHGDLRQIKLGAGGNDVGLVHAAGGNTIDIERPSDEQEARRQLLKEDHTTTTETTGEENEHSAGGDALAERCAGASGLVVGQRATDLFSGIKARRLGEDGTLLTLLAKSLLLLSGSAGSLRSNLLPGSGLLSPLARLCVMSRAR
eukprot:Mycagemm_TRINITY_DN10390_c6_g7::TRINITY_DN10390_c6_g7_i1::g.808::m.808 type:complete len:220 gc:universal TRINITY_DN10390_c6_g7_i1:151-810(+)